MSQLPSRAARGFLISAFFLFYALTRTLHWLHVIGMRTTGCGYVTNTRIALFFGLFTP